MHTTCIYIGKGMKGKSSIKKINKHKNKKKTIKVGSFLVVYF